MSTERHKIYVKRSKICVKRRKIYKTIILDLYFIDLQVPGVNSIENLKHRKPGMRDVACDVSSMARDSKQLAKS